jgi:hypothetical protein
MHFSGFFKLPKRKEYPTVMKCAGENEVLRRVPVQPEAGGFRR